MKTATLPEWFSGGKFGMFIHWGPYSVLGGEWNGRRIEPGDIAEWIMQRFQIPVAEYRKVAASFHPDRFDAREWVALAKKAGMTYLIITAKHHDGFAMFDSEASGYNIVDHARFGRDPLKELSEACAEAGIKFGVYYSHREDWDHPYAYGNTWDFDSSQTSLDTMDHPELFRKYLDDKALPQLRELLTRYGPLGIVWFDRGMYTPEQGREFADLVHALQPGCLVNGRVGHYDQELLGDYQSLTDNGMPVGGIEEAWETPQTLNDTWGYSRFDQNWKSAGDVIKRMVAIVSKGGNYLLNVGPTGEGVIPAPSVDVLKSVGAWMDKNKSSVRQKLNPIASEIKGKKVLLVDDSIVRGNTSRAIIEMLREAGAKKVYFASYSPPLRFPCVYGIDMQTKTEFVAQDADEAAVAKRIGADKVIYQSLAALKKAVRQENPKIKSFCAACFDGIYPTGDITPELLEDIESDRKQEQDAQLELNI